MTGRRTVRRHPPEVLGQLRGQVLSSVGRHGKYLLLGWHDRQVLVAHLRMSGQMLAANPGDPLVPHTHAVFHFSDVGELRFVDPRTFGELFLAGSPCPSAGASRTGQRPKSSVPGLVPGLVLTSSGMQLEGLGADALAATPAHFRSVLAGRRAPLKALLVDQRVVAGVGNIYADEICFVARLRPDRPAGDLRPGELRRLSAATRSVLEDAIEAGGSTLRDARYRDVLGKAGFYQLQHRVYGRAGGPCLTCGTAIERRAIGAKSAYFCPRCQR